MNMLKEVLQAEARNVLEHGVLDECSIVLELFGVEFALSGRFAEPLRRSLIVTVFHSIVHRRPGTGQIVRIVRQSTVRAVSKLRRVLPVKSLLLLGRKQIVFGQVQFAQAVLSVYVRISFLVAFHQFAGYLDRDALVVFAQTGEGTVDYAAW